ncbi:unnamed protein product, partial [Tetraodon nigroviridis]
IGHECPEHAAGPGADCGHAGLVCSDGGQRRRAPEDAHRREDSFGELQDQILQSEGGNYQVGHN